MANSSKWVTLDKTTWQQVANASGIVSIQLEDNRGYVQYTASETLPTGDQPALRVQSADQIITVGEKAKIWVRGSGRVAVLTVA